MKPIIKATLVAAFAAGVLNAVLSRVVAHRARSVRRTRIANSVPTLKAVADAEPNVQEPLREADLRVAQNSPL